MSLVKRCDICGEEIAYSQVDTTVSVEMDSKMVTLAVRVLGSYEKVPYPGAGAPAMAYPAAIGAPYEHHLCPDCFAKAIAKLKEAL